MGVAGAPSRRGGVGQQSGASHLRTGRWCRRVRRADHLWRSGAPYALTAEAFIKASLVTSGAITNRIDRIETKGLVRRARDATADRRAVLIQLTPHGRELVDEVFALYLAGQERMLAGLRPKERDRLADALRGVLESFGDTPLA
jgi:DNA-binding MarR family transcriptional regulator